MFCLIYHRSLVIGATRHHRNCFVPLMITIAKCKLIHLAVTTPWQTKPRTKCTVWKQKSVSYGPLLPHGQAHTRNKHPQSLATHHCVFRKKILVPANAEKAPWYCLYCLYVCWRTYESSVNFWSLLPRGSVCFSPFTCFVFTEKVVPSLGLFSWVCVFL